MTFDWKKLFGHLLGPKQHISRKCLIDGLPMVIITGVYQCANGHRYDPDKVSGLDAVTEASKGHHSGEI